MGVAVVREKGCLREVWMCVGKSNIQILSANTISFRAEIIGLLASLETLPVQELALMASCKVVSTKAGGSGLVYVLTLLEKRLVSPFFQCNLCGQHTSPFELRVCILPVALHSSCTTERKSVCVPISKLSQFPITADFKTRANATRQHPIIRVMADNRYTGILF